MAKNKKLERLREFKTRLMSEYWLQASTKKRKELLNIVEVEERFIDKYAEIHRMDKLHGAIRAKLLHKWSYNWRYRTAEELYITVPKKTTKTSPPVRKYSITPEHRKEAIAKAAATRKRNVLAKQLKVEAIKAKAKELETIMAGEVRNEKNADLLKELNAIKKAGLKKVMGKGLKAIKEQKMTKPRYKHRDSTPKDVSRPIKARAKVKVKAKPGRKPQTRKQMYKEFRKVYKSDKQAAVQKQKDLNKKQVVNLKTRLAQEKNTNKKLRTLMNNFITDAKKLVG